jgi:hypothetical protein
VQRWMNRFARASRGAEALAPARRCRAPRDDAQGACRERHGTALCLMRSDASTQGWMRCAAGATRRRAAAAAARRRPALADDDEASPQVRAGGAATRRRCAGVLGRTLGGAGGREAGVWRWMAGGWVRGRREGVVDGKVGERASDRGFMPCRALAGALEARPLPKKSRGTRRGGTATRRDVRGNRAPLAAPSSRPPRSSSASAQHARCDVQAARFTRHAVGVASQVAAAKCQPHCDLCCAAERCRACRMHCARTAPKEQHPSPSSAAQRVTLGSDAPQGQICVC